MTLPNGQQAIVPIEKLRDYALNPAHPGGRHKARVFRSALGLTKTDADILREKLIRVAATDDAREVDPTPHGQRYIIDFDMTTDAGSATVRSAWMIRNNENVPRLTSCYIIS